MSQVKQVGCEQQAVSPGIKMCVMQVEIALPTVQLWLYTSTRYSVVAFVFIMFTHYMIKNPLFCLWFQHYETAVFLSD